ncbi:hypothetical protein KCU99_g9187, partial [Aureobasidium melanogenum]
MASTFDLTDLHSYDHRRFQADGRSQSMAWGNTQPMYSQYLLPEPYPMLNQYSYFSGLFPPPTLQETLINQLYQPPLYPWQASMQDGVAGPVHGTDFGIQPSLSSPTMLDMYSQIQDRGQAQAQASSDSAGLSGSPQQLQLMQPGSTRTASPASTGTAEDLVKCVCDTFWRPQEFGRRDPPTSSFEIKPGSVDISVRFVVESSWSEYTNQETSQEIQADELAQQPLKEVLRILSSRASHIPGEHEISISSDATSTKIQAKYRGLD